MSRRVMGGAALVLLASTWLAAEGAATDQPLRVVESLDWSRFAGKWYEVARLPDARLQPCAGDVIVRYTPRPDGRLDVLNRCKRHDGSQHEAYQLARKSGDGKNNATLELRKAPTFLSFLPTAWDDYWIIGLGPDYTWAVVGAPNRQRLWILSRTPGMTESSFNRALEIAKGTGFDVERLVKTRHGER